MTGDTEGGSVAPWYRPELIDEAHRRRSTRQRRRALVALAVSTAVTIVWASYVTLAGHWPRVTRNWAAAVTMAFGSFVAGSTPQGGGAVAFPVFTKVLAIPSEVARSFSLCIQTVGMGTASVAILINRRLVEWRAVAVGGSVAVVSFLVSLAVIGDRSRPFWPATVPSAYVKVTFTLILAAMAFVVYLSTRVPLRKIETTLPPMNARLYAGLVIAGLIGGLASVLTGSGADVLIFLFVVVLFGLDPKVGVPTSVLTMALVSATAFVTLGLVDGQLAVGLSADGTSVMSVGGQAVSHGPGVMPAYGPGEPLPANRFDLFGMWIASVPIVAWGAPLGSRVADRLRTRHLVVFVTGLAALELVTTAAFLPELHTVGPLLAYAIVGLTITMAALYLMARHRRQLFQLPGIELDRTLSADQLDWLPGFHRHVRSTTVDDGEG